MKTLTHDALVYEEMDGHPVMYKNFHKVLLSQANIEDIMGSSQSQSIVVSAIFQHLFSLLNRKTHWLLTNEAGLHLGQGNNLAADLAIFDRARVVPDIKNSQYVEVAPLIVIEVDIKADMSDFPTPHDYYRKKARKLREFGVHKVIWVNTQSETVMFDDELTSYPWTKPIDLSSIIPGLILSISEAIRAF
jgi:Uma2 family endonuclease